MATLNEEHAKLQLEYVKIKRTLDELVPTHQKLLQEYQKLRTEFAMLKAQQRKEDEFVPSGGVLWKRTATGFEQFPYCNECSHHPVMSAPRGIAIWICSQGHQAPRTQAPA